MNNIQQEFIESWMAIKDFYDCPSMRMFLGNEVAERMIALVNAMQEEGYASHFRAGQSMYLLILSRSWKHGLREEQHFISFSPKYWPRIAPDETPKISESFEVSYHANRTIIQKIEQDKISLTEEIRQMLQRLLEQSIN